MERTYLYSEKLQNNKGFLENKKDRISAGIAGCVNWIQASWDLVWQSTATFIKEVGLGHQHHHLSAPQ